MAPGDNEIELEKIWQLGCVFLISDAEQSTDALLTIAKTFWAQRPQGMEVQKIIVWKKGADDAQFLMFTQSGEYAGVEKTGNGLIVQELDTESGDTRLIWRIAKDPEFLFKLEVMDLIFIVGRDRKSRSFVRLTVILF